MDTDKILDKLGKIFSTPKGIIGGLAAIMAVIVLISGISEYVGTRNTGRELEIGLTKQFKTVQINYGQFRMQIHDELGIAREKRDAIDKIIVDAVAGRYNADGKENDVTAGVDRGKLFSAIKEAYPDLEGLKIYDKILDHIQAGRKRFAAEQVQLADQVARYNTWRTTGWLLHPWMVEKLGFPSGNLEVQIGDKHLTGSQALEKMNVVIVGGDTQQVFDTGIDTPVGQVSR